MKRFLSLFLLTVLLLPLTMTAQADVIWEPEDDFYTRHQDDFQFAGYCAYTNSPAGKTQVYDSPEGGLGELLENGQLVYVQYLYMDDSGEDWAYLADDRYIYLPHLIDRYDGEFHQDHAEEIFQDRPEFTVALEEGQPFRAWSYPRGSSWEEVNYFDSDLVAGCSDYYTDDQGLVWGYIAYWYGHQNYWVCLSDINNPDLAESEHYTGQIFWGENAQLRPDAVAPVPEKTFQWLYVVLPLGAAVLSATLILCFPKKKRQEADSQGPEL